ncbi:Uncharacterised protein [Enterococcus casseliflavus]|nr:Uncharacterised protein [Enterococcus casseliflavus]
MIFECSLFFGERKQLTYVPPLLTAAGQISVIDSYHIYQI